MRHLPLAAAAFLSSALLAACGGGSAPAAAPVYTAPTTIQGTVSGWIAGAATVAAVEGTTTLSTAPLAASGTFDLTLPSVAAITPYLSAMSSADFTTVAGCSGALTVSDPTAGSFTITDLVASANGTSKNISAGTETTSSTTTSFSYTLDSRIWVYADRPVKLGGSATCNDTVEGIPVTIRFGANAQLGTGWNILQTKAVLTATQTTGTFNINLNNVVDGRTAWIDSTTPSISASLSSSAGAMRQYASGALRSLPLR